MPTILSILTALITTAIVVGIILWLVSLVRMDQKIKDMINAFVVILALLWLLSVFLGMPPLGTLRFPQEEQQ